MGGTTEQYIYNPVYVKIALYVYAFIWKCMERGLDGCILNCGKWNVIGSAGEKVLFVLIPVCIIYILYNELVVIYTFIIKEKWANTIHNRKCK